MLLNVLSDAIPDEDRILTIEDTGELSIRKPHIVSAESQTDTHRGQISFNTLLKAVLRHRPGRIIVGEVRGAEASELLVALEPSWPLVDASLVTVNIRVVLFPS